MPIILSPWESLITYTICPSASNLLALTDEYCQQLIYKSELEIEKVRTLIIINIVDKPEIKDKEQFIKLNQALLIRLQDVIFTSRKLVEGNEMVLRLYDTISVHLEQRSLSYESFLVIISTGVKRFPSNIF